MLQRRSVLVVGGSAGIGLAIAHQFAADGYALYLVARDPVRLSAAADQLSARHGVEVHSIAMDATAEGCPARLAEILGQIGADLAYAVIGPGFWPSAGRSEFLEPAELRRTLEINVVAHHALYRLIAPHLAACGGILFVGSLAGCLPLPWLSAYSASKACLHASVLGLRQEMSGKGINVCVLAPGVVLTDFLPHSRESKWRWLLDILASSPDCVARAAYCGLKSNVAVIVPGLVWRLIWLGMRITPASLLARLSGQFLRPLCGNEAMMPPGGPTQ